MSISNSYIKISRFLEQGRSLVWARIINRIGSAPRSVGADILMLDNGTTIDTIGGGALEHKVCIKAKEMLNGEHSKVLYFKLQGEDTAKTEMLCGGTVEVLLTPLNPSDKETVNVFSATRDLILSGASGVFITQVTPSGKSTHRSRWILIREDGTILGKPPSSYSLPEFLSLPSPTIIRIPGSEEFCFAEPLRSIPEVLLFGAGHVSTCIAPLAKMVGFRVTVIDDRMEFANLDRFPTADEVQLLAFDPGLKALPTTPHSYIVIVTRGHSYDKVVLELMLDKPHAYIGMIGSVKKKSAIYRALKEAGVSEETLARVHSPIGLDIGAETPEEIAISVVAELIDVRASKGKKKTFTAVLPIHSEASL